MILLRRFLVLIALFFWQGGFTFYASVVVPVGQQVFSHRHQGFITREVTVYLNLTGALALVILLWDLLAGRDAVRWRRGLRILSWVVMVLTLAALFWLHPRLAEFLDADSLSVVEPRTFRPRHRLYLWISTVQWVAGLLFLGSTLMTWRAHDRLTGAQTPSRSDPASS
jgi:hypothetical protein